MEKTRPENAVQEAVSEFLVDPDAPERGHAEKPPQTIDAEPGETKDKRQG